MGNAIQKIRESKSPSGALVIVAELIDQLEDTVSELSDRVNHIEVNDDISWGAWEKPAKPAESDQPAEAWIPDPQDEVLLKQYEEELKGNPDAEESRVLRAKIELQRDKLQPPPELHDNAGQAIETHYDSEGNAIVDLPKPTPEQIDTRAQLVGALGLRDQYGEEAGALAEDSFVRGGPLLLYLSDRDFVNSLPPGLKIALVEDVEKSSPRDAHEMGRDILKASTDEANDLDFASERIINDLSTGAIHNAP